MKKELTIKKEFTKKVTYTKPAMQKKKSLAVISGSSGCDCGNYVSRSCGDTYYY
jgi:hypothetical protein